MRSYKLFLFLGVFLLFSKVQNKDKISYLANKAYNLAMENSMKTEKGSIYIPPTDSAYYFVFPAIREGKKYLSIFKTEAISDKRLKGSYIYDENANGLRRGENDKVMEKGFDPLCSDLMFDQILDQYNKDYESWLREIIDSEEK